MQIHICITKEDIKTRQLGDNFEIELPNGMFLNFTREAIHEFTNDLATIIKAELEAETFSKTKSGVDDFGNPTLGEDKRLTELYKP